MTQRRHHYEVAFEDFLRAKRIPYVAVDEAKKSLLPAGRTPALEAQTVKSFDFVLYGDSTNLLVEVKGRRLAPRRVPKVAADAAPRRPLPDRSEPTLFRLPPARSAMQNWVTRDDVESLATWERLFGRGFEAVFVFVYWCEEQPPDALFHELFENRGRWYALRSVRVGDYAREMTCRSERWHTVHVPTREFDRISRPFSPPGEGSVQTGVLVPLPEVPGTVGTRLSPIGNRSEPSGGRCGTVTA